MAAITKGTLCQIAEGPANSKPRWVAWSPSLSEQPAVDTPYRSYGLAATDAEEETALAVVTYGYLRGVSAMNSETWDVGEYLWAAADGSLTHTRPDAPLPQVFCAVVFEDEGTTFALDVYVRMLPSLGELSGVNRVAPADKDVLVYSDTENYWDPRPLVINDLADVEVATPNDGDVLTWDSGSSLWIAAPPPAGAPGSASASVSPSGSASPSASTSPSASASASGGGSASASVSPSSSSSRSVSPSASASLSLSPSASQSPSASSSATPSHSLSPSASESSSASPSPIGATGHRVERFALFSPPAGGSTYPLIKAPAAYTVKAIRVIHTGSGSLSVNGIKNARGSPSDVLGGDLSSGTTWQTSSTVSVSLAAGDELDVELIGVTGYVEHVVVQVDYEESI